MRFAVLADAHIGRSIPLAIAEHRRQAFSRAFTKAVDAIVDAGVDYVFFCGDLFERRTLRPYLVQFAHDELYRLAWQTEEHHGKHVKILLIRGNHDGRPQSNTLDYIKHPLADYLHVFDEDNIAYTDEVLHVVGLNYYDRIDLAFETLVKPAFEDAEKKRVFMVHGFIYAYNDVPPYHSGRTLTLDQIASVDSDLVFTGHSHRRSRPQRLPNGGWIVTPGSLEMYDFAENPDKGFYIGEHLDSAPRFTWVPIEPMHVMKQVTIKPNQRRTPEWYRKEVRGEVEAFRSELEKSGKPGYLRVRVQGDLKDGYPSDIDLSMVNDLVADDPLLLWVDVDTLRLKMPLLPGVHEREIVNIKAFFDVFGEFADDISEMHAKIQDIIEEEASLQTRLLTPSSRTSLIQDWVKRFEKHSFRGTET